MTEPVAPEGVDTTRPNAARMYDYYLGGSHSFPADREAAERVIAATPLVTTMAASNRDWMRRVVTHVVRDLDVRQVLDLGSGIPTRGNVHEIANSIAEDATVVYVDIEPVAVAHAALMLAADERVLVVQDDIRNVEPVLHQAASVLDFGRPTMVMMSSVLPFIADDPGPIVDSYILALCSGSYLAISHASLDGLDPGLLPKVSQGAEVYERAEQPVTLRTYSQIVGWFHGVALIPPGLVRLECWKPEVAEPEMLPMIAYGGLGQVP